MNSILGLDIGDRRIGIAVSSSGIFASGLETYTRVTLNKDAQYIADVAKKWSACVIVAGLPQHLDGTEHEQATKNETLLEQLRLLGFEIKYFDERLTSSAAENYMLAADLSRKKRKENIDKLAAQIILQNYLDAQNNGGFYNGK